MVGRTLAAVAGLAMTGLAWGQPPADRPLAGPPVKQDRPAGLGGQFSDGKGDRKGPMTERVPMRLYSQAVERLRAEDAPADLRLSREQEQEIRQIEMNFRNVMQEHVRRARVEGGAQVKPLPPTGEVDKDQMAAENQRARARNQEFMRNAPDPTDAQVRIYAVLNPAQQKFVEGEVAKVQAELEKRRTEEYMQRQLQKKKGEGQPAPAIAPGPIAGAPEGRERMRRLAERLQQLSPEEREQLLSRIEAELDRRGIGAGDGGRKRPGGGDNKPAPKVDDVKVPAPEKP